LASRYKRNEEEKRIRDKEIRPLLEGLGWLVEVTHGNKYMKGFPDLYLGHPQYGQRWVDVKVENNYDYTPAQRDKWPKWHTYGIGIWIMTAGTHEQVERLFRSPNWLDYWKPRYGDPFNQPDLDELLDTIDDVEI
jgi:hypothetical protein